MDSDGEDKPEYIKDLINTMKNNPNKIIFADRTKRSESLMFRLFYFLYKLLFRTLTGSRISFGNFCLIPNDLLGRIVTISDIWNHFSSGVIHSQLPYMSIPTERGSRILGRPKMQYSSLILHGLSSISVYIDIVGIRVIIFSILLMLPALAGVVIAFSLRLFTNLASQGWATTLSIGLTTIFMLSGIISLLVVLFILSYRTQKQFLPKRDYIDYMLDFSVLK